MPNSRLPNPWVLIQRGMDQAQTNIARQLYTYEGTNASIGSLGNIITYTGALPVPLEYQTMSNTMGHYENLVNTGYLTRTLSPDGKLVQFHYTQKCIDEKSWDDYTGKARGIIYELATGKLVASPFGKFLETDSVTPSNADKCTVTEWLEGDLGIAYYHDGKWNMAARDGFDTPAAVRGTEMFSKLPKKGVQHAMTSDHTYLFNIGPDKLSLLAAGRLDRPTREIVVKHLEIGIPIRYEMTYEECLADLPDLDESQKGFVIRLPFGRISLMGDAYRAKLNGGIV